MGWSEPLIKPPFDLDRSIWFKAWIRLESPETNPRDPFSLTASPPLPRHQLSSPVISRRKTHPIFFVSTRRVQRQSWLVKPSPVERETGGRRSSSADRVFHFRPRRRLKLVCLASSRRVEHKCGLGFSNRRRERENRKGEIHGFPIGFSDSGDFWGSGWWQ